mmetsp:Transcript_34585/g.56091  ORF Transcript_34585/g.56091 Transcript_34585/m.56091 type:complete len:397 (+) Transcript_34585:215-1405(+)
MVMQSGKSKQGEEEVEEKEAAHDESEAQEQAEDGNEDEEREESAKSSRVNKMLALLNDTLNDKWKPVGSKRVRKKKKAFTFFQPDKKRPKTEKSKTHSGRLKAKDSTTQKQSWEDQGSSKSKLLLPAGSSSLTEEDDGIWEEAKASKITVLGHEASVFSKVVLAVGMHLKGEAARDKVDINWEAVAKTVSNFQGKKQITAPLCQALWRLAAYKMDEGGTVQDYKLVKNTRVLKATKVEDDSSDIDENACADPTLVERAKDKITEEWHEFVLEDMLTPYFPRPPYVQLSSEEAWDGTGFSRPYVDQHQLPTYTWKRTDDLQLMNAIITAASDDWNEIREHTTSLKFLQPDVLQKRYIQMQKLVDEKRFKEPRILEMFDQFEKRLHPDVKKRLAATEP